jgi:arylsulfatase
MPKLFDLRTDPYERADVTGNTYYDWFLANAGVIHGLLAGTEEFLKTFRDVPPRQRASSFSIDQAVEKMRKGLGGD